MMTTNYPYRLWLLGLTVLVASFAGASWVLYSYAGDGSAKSGKGTPAAGSSEQSAVCIGYVDVESRVTPIYPAQPGKVTEVLVHEDEAVKEGAVLFRMDDRQVKFLLQQAEVDRQAAELELSKAKKLPEQQKLKIAQQQQVIRGMEKKLSAARHMLDRQKRLQKIQLVPDEDVAAAEDGVAVLEATVAGEKEKLRELELFDPATEVSLAQAKVTAKQIDVDKAKRALDECSVQAPVAGKVLRLNVSVGDLFTGQPRQAAVEFCPNSPRMVRAEVEQEYAGRVAVGQAAVVEDDSKADHRWRGKVVRVSDWYTHRRSIIQEPLQFNDVRTLECLVLLDPDQPMPRIGQRVRVRLGQAATSR
jgi:multidrug resistance efflux pump